MESIMSKVAIQGNASGSGVLTIAAPNTNSNFTLDIPSASGTIDRLNRAGNVLQVVSAFKDDTFSTSSGSHVDITGLSVSITPTSSSSKVLVIFTIGCLGTDGNAALALRLLRGVTAIAQPDEVVNEKDGVFNFYNNNQTGIGIGASLNYLDSPATTSSTTYKVSAYTNAGTLYINRLPGDSTWQSTSSITVMEIAA
jgi:hypothetical protein